VDDLWATKSEDVGLIVRAVSFQDFQAIWSWSTNVINVHTSVRTDGRPYGRTSVRMDRLPYGRTDGWTTCNCKTALCTV